MSRISYTAMLIFVTQDPNDVDNFFGNFMAHRHGFAPLEPSMFPL